MYEKEGIIYSGNTRPILKVIEVVPMQDFMLKLEFNDGVSKLFDFKPLLNNGVFKVLNNEDIFCNIKLDFGVPTWEDVEVDISPEYLYENGEIY